MRTPTGGLAARRALRRPEVRTDLLQVAKAALATALAWVLATELLDLREPFLAAWSALLVVHATVRRSLVRGAQSVLATSLGVLLAAGLALSPLGGAPALAVATLVGLLAARLPVLRLEGVAVATSALFILVAADPTSVATVSSWLVSVLLGTAVGVLVNVVVVPPLDDGAAGRLLEDVLRRLGALLRRIATELPETDDDARPAATPDDSARPDGPDDDAERPPPSGEADTAAAWSATTRELDETLDRARALVRYTREAQTLNPRRRFSAHAGTPGVYDDLLARLEDAVGNTRAIARVVSGSVGTTRAWDDEFRRRWVELLDETGRRVADPDEDVGDVRTRLDRLAEDMSTENLPGLLWPTYGSLIMALRGVLVAVDDEETVRWRAGLGGED